MGGERTAAITVIVSSLLSSLRPSRGTKFFWDDFFIAIRKLSKLFRGKYLHRVAISNNRIVDVSEDEVGFIRKDYRDGNKKKIMKLKVEEFIRRFLLHVLPKGFMRIRFYGLFSNRYKQNNLKLIRELLNEKEDTNSKEKKELLELIEALNEKKTECPRCQR